MIRLRTLILSMKAPSSHAQEGQGHDASCLSILQRWLKNQPPAGANLAPRRKSVSRDESRQQPPQANMTLTLLKLAAVSLPGLAASPLHADEAVEWLANTHSPHTGGCGLCANRSIEAGGRPAGCPDQHQALQD